MTEAPSALAKLREKTKMEVRALLESAPYSVTVREAPREYREQTGCELPFRLLGYASAEELFRAMPDTLVIAPSPRGPILKCLANESTQHVELMVRTQKKAPNTKVYHLPKAAPVTLKSDTEKKPLLAFPPLHLSNRMHNSLGSQSRSPPPLMPSMPPPLIPPPYPYPFAAPVGYFHPPPHGVYPAAYSTYMQRNMCAYQQYPCASNRPLPFMVDQHRRPIPDHVKRDVQQILKNNSQGLSLEVFRLLFNETFKYPLIPEKFGYQTYFEMISAMPDVAGIKNAGNYFQIVPASMMSVPPGPPPTVEPLSVQPQQQTAELQIRPCGGMSELRKSPERGDNPEERAVPSFPSAAMLHAALGLNLNPPQACAKPTDPSHKDNCHSDPPNIHEKPSEPISDGSSNIHSLMHEKPPLHNGSRQNDSWATWEDKKAAQLSAQPTSSSINAASDRNNSEWSQNCHRLNDQSAELEQSVQIESDSIRSPTRDLQAENCPKRTKDKGRSGNTASRSIGDKMKAAFSQIMEVNPNGIWASELMSKYQKLTGCRLDFREFGFYSIMELVINAPDVFSIKRSKKTGECLLLPVNHKTEENPDSGMDTLSRSSSPKVKSKKKEVHSPSVGLQLQRKLMEVICSCPDGVVLSEFENIYQVFHNEALNLDSLKHYTAEALFLSLSDIIILDYIDDKTILVKPTVSGKKLLDIPGPKPEKFRLKTSYSIAHDAVVTVAPIKWQDLPKLSPGKRYIEVYVTYIIDPSNFYVHLRGIDTSVALDELMDKMRQLYYHPLLSKRYRVPDELEIGFDFYCAALYPHDQNWHRAMVTGNNPDGTFTVWYVDFGNETTLPRKSIRLLKREYMKLPAQALQAKLANIIPISRGTSSEWSPAAVQRFKDMCLRGPLVASVVDIEEKRLSLSLYDTSGENDIRVNDTLVSENYATLAIFHPMVTQTDRMLGRTANPRNELRNSMSSCNSLKELELGMSASQGRQSANSEEHGLGSSASTDAEGELHACPDAKSLTRVEGLAQEISGLQLEKDLYHVTEAILADRPFHVIRLDGIDFVPTFEISQLFWKSDILRRMVMLTPLSVDFCVIEKASRPILHRDISRLRKNGNTSDGNVALCPLKRIPDILPLFIGSEDELPQAFEDLVKLRDA